MTDESPTAVRDEPETSQRRRRIQQDIVRGSLWTLLASAVNLPLGFALSVVVVHALGPHEYAKFALWVTVFGLTVPLANGGISEATMQWAAAQHVRGETADLVALVRRCSGYHLLVQGPVTTAVAVVLLWGSDPRYLVLAVATNALYVVAETSSVTLMGLARNDLVARFALVMNVFSSVAVAVAAATVHTAAAAWSLALAAMAVGPVLGFFALPPQLRRAVLRPALPRGFPDGFRRYALSAYLAGLVAFLVWGRSEIFVLQLHGLVLAVALYAVVTVVSQKLTFFIDSMTAPLAPASAALLAADPSIAERAVCRALRVTSLLGGLTAALLLPAATVLLGPLYGGSFAAAQGALVALGLLSCLQSVANPVKDFAFATRSAPAVLAINVACLAVDAGLAFGLVPVIGLAGAVVANCAAQTVSLVLQLRVVARKIGSSPLTLLRSTTAFAVLGSLGPAAALAASRLTGSVVLDLLVALAVGAAVVLVLLLALPGLRLAAADADAIAAALPSALQRVFGVLRAHLPVVQPAPVHGAL